jgi:hypothetical protein
MSNFFLSQKDLARRWCISPRTLERWRWVGEGPSFLKLGSRVVYRIRDVDEYERKHLRTPTPREEPAEAVERPAER